MFRPGSDNDLAETVVGLYKNECVKIDGPFRTVDELELATLSWVHWFNENWLHSSIGYLTPIEAENEYYRENTTRQQPLPGQLALHQTRAIHCVRRVRMLLGDRRKRGVTVKGWASTVGRLVGPASRRRSCACPLCAPFR